MQCGRGSDGEGWKSSLNRTVDMTSEMCAPGNECDSHYDDMRRESPDTLRNPAEVRANGIVDPLHKTAKFGCVPRIGQETGADRGGEGKGRHMSYVSGEVGKE